MAGPEAPPAVARGSPGNDLRVAALGLTAWAAALAGFALDGRLAWALFGLAAAPLARPRGRSSLRLGLLLIAATVLLVTQLRVGEVRSSSVATLAGERAAVSADLIVRTAPERRSSRYGDFVRAEASVVTVIGRGRRFADRSRVLLIVDGDADLRAGSRVRVRGRLGPATGPELAGVLQTRGPPVLLAEPGLIDRVSNRMRTAVRDASAGRGGGGSALVPALVDGDESAAGGTAEFTPAFQTAGMTHLLAVSGTNLTLILSAFLFFARWCRVRAWGLVVVGGLGVVSFVLLAGPEPSVLRAAAMGTVALVGLGRAGRARGTRALGAAVLALVLLDPWLARSPGFVLSVVATAGILVLAPPWRDALSRWLPRWLAEAVAIPLAAQVACTPIVAAISGQVSLVAVGANIVAAPLVGPATVLGLLGGMVALASIPLGRLVAMPAGWCAEGIIAVAERSSSMPVPALPWSTGVFAVALLSALCVGLGLVLGAVLARRAVTLSLTSVLCLLIVVPLPAPGWPPPGWVMVACDVGQGDALVLRAGEHSAVVVDAGPDPVPVDRCLKRLRVRSVPVLVVTHFHADHVDGIAGVLRGRWVGRIDTSPLPEPASGAREISEAARAADVPVREVELGERTTVGEVGWQVLGPTRLHSPESGSPPNDASVVLLVETRGLRLLLLGDEERPSQVDLRRTWPGLTADVLKVAHHGSSNQDDELLRGLGARVAMVSAGRDNDYGHPAGRTLDLLTSARMRVLRTDRDGDIAVAVDGAGTLATSARGVGAP